MREEDAGRGGGGGGDRERERVTPMHCQVTKELKQMAYALQENKLALLKAQATARTEERKRQEAIRVREAERREKVVREVFNKWAAAGEETEEGVPFAEVSLHV